MYIYIYTFVFTLTNVNVCRLISFKISYSMTLSPSQGRLFIYWYKLVIYRSHWDIILQGNSTFSCLVLEYEQPLSKYAPTCNKETLFKKFRSSGMHGVDNISEVDGTYAIMQPEGASKVMIIEHLCSTERHAESDLLRVMKSHYKDRTSKPADAEKEDMCMYLNRSCCAKCAEEIIAFCSSHRAKLEIVCASLSCCRRVTCYECNKDAIGDGVTSSYEWNTIAMKKLLLEADIHFRAFVYEDWKKLRELINSSDYDREFVFLLRCKLFFKCLSMLGYRNYDLSRLFII